MPAKKRPSAGEYPGGAARYRRELPAIILPAARVMAHPA